MAGRPHLAGGIMHPLTRETDASVTQSALEDALASQMNRGAISSRFSISGAFRSRYAPGANH